MWWVAAAIAADPVWVAAPAFPGRALDRVVRQAEKRGAVVETVAKGVRCLRFEEAPDPVWIERAGRRLDAPLESRATCAVARYPLGQGYYAAMVAADPDLDAKADVALEGLSMSVLARPLDGRPSTLCVSRLQVSVEQLGDRMRAADLSVLGIYEVGSCSSRIHF